MPRVAGVDPGTVSFDLCVLHDGEPVAEDQLHAGLLRGPDGRPHAVAGGENLSLNDKAGPVSGPIGAGVHTLHQTWIVSAEHPKALLGKAASAEFAPDPALDPLWISYKEPFHGASKKDFGLQITIKIADDTPTEPK